MIELLEGLQFWHWWVFAGALVVVETLLPSGILYGAAFAAFLVGGGLAAGVEMSWRLQVGAWAGLSIVLGSAGRAIRKRGLAPKASTPDVPIDSRPSPLKPPAPNPLGEPAATEKPLDLKTPAPTAPAPSGSDLVGGVYTIWSPMAGGTGAIKVKGAAYVLSGPDLPAGSRIKVTTDDGTTLTVEAAD